MSSNNPDPKYAQYATEQLEKLLSQTLETGESNRIKEELKRRFAEQYVNIKVDLPTVPTPAKKPVKTTNPTNSGDSNWGCIVFVVIIVVLLMAGNNC
ncbi:MAG TPA: hypothetical protein VF703_03620 [Pyrinomonadaceae bacterium]|jgi:hypothetical protein